MSKKLDLDKLFKELYAIKKERKKAGKDGQVEFCINDFPSAEAAARFLGVFTKQSDEWIAQKTKEWGHLRFRKLGNGIIDQLRRMPPLK